MNKGPWELHVDNITDVYLDNTVEVKLKRINADNKFPSTDTVPLAFFTKLNLDGHDALMSITLLKRMAQVIGMEIKNNDIYR